MEGGRVRGCGMYKFLLRSQIPKRYMKRDAVSSVSKYGPIEEGKSIMRAYICGIRGRKGELWDASSIASSDRPGAVDELDRPF